MRQLGGMSGGKDGLTVDDFGEYFYREFVHGCDRGEDGKFIERIGELVCLETSERRCKNQRDAEQASDLPRGSASLDLSRGSKHYPHTLNSDMSDSITPS